MRLIILPVLFIIFLFPTSILCAQSVKDVYEQAVEAYNKGQFKQAIDLYGQIIQVLPTFAPAYNGLGLAVKGDVGDEEKAIEYFKLAIHYDPQYAQSYDNLGRIYYERQDFDLAQASFEKALKLDPNLYSSRSSLAWIYLLVKVNPAKAVGQFKKALELNQQPNTYLGLGLAYFSNNQRAEALEIVTKLRGMGQENSALQLEGAIRENRHVAVEAKAVKLNPAGVSPKQDDDLPLGIKVRLRGKLAELQ